MQPNFEKWQTSEIHKFERIGKTLQFGVESVLSSFKSNSYNKYNITAQHNIRATKFVNRKVENCKNRFLWYS